MIRIIMLGAPGSGKGTQAQLLSQYFNIPFISAGEILRQEIKKNKKTKTYIKNTLNTGKLINDSFIIKLIKKKIKKKKYLNGFILDGFPRTMNQAQSLNQIIHIKYIIYLKINSNDVTNRIKGRLIHESSGRTYHKLFNPPKQKYIDDITGEKLIKREDDNEKTMLRRLIEYKKYTKPLINWLNQKKKENKFKYLEISANQSISNVNKQIIYSIKKNYN